MNFQLTYYKTRGGLRVHVDRIEEPDRALKYATHSGYYQVGDNRIRIYWDASGDEIHGEKGLDLMKVIVEGDYLIRKDRND